LSEAVRRHKDRAAAFLAKGKRSKALKEYRAALQYAPHDVALRQKLADLLVRLEHTDAAVREYQAVAGKYAADGFLVKAMAICKVILKLDPDHTETQEALASLYSEHSPQGVLPPSMTGALSGGGLRITPAKAAGEEDSQRNPRAPARAMVPSMSVPSAMRAIDMSAIDALPGGVTSGIDIPAHDASEPAPARETGPTALPGAGVPKPGMPELPGTPVAASEDERPLSDDESTMDEDDPDTLVLGAFDAKQMMRELEQDVQRSQSGLYFDLVDDELEDDDDAGTSGEVELITTAQADTEEMEIDVSRFPPIPLFADLDKQAFVALFDRLEVRSAMAGETLIKEGATTTSMFIVAQGEVRVFRDKGSQQTELARLSDGSFFGEIALLSDSPRMASVETARPTLLLEMSRDDVAELIQSHPAMVDVLGNFYRERFLANLVRSNPLIFQPLTDDEKREIFEHFQSVTVPPQTVILKKGEMGQGLYLILRGECDVLDAAPDGRLFALPVLREGDFFGEMSLLLNTPVNATVSARTTCTVLRLPREIFYERVMKHPEVRRVITTVTNERIKQAAALEAGYAQDDPVLV
jgi:CRP-like cAMP-binding protein